MKSVLLLLFVFLTALLPAQVITTDPAAPLADRPLTITFDATQGTAGLQDCGCDIYLHTGIITPASADGNDWQFVKTTWAVANADWKLTPVADQPNKYTYTFSPSIRGYFGAPEDTEIQQIALVFRNADGTLEGKAAGGQNIYIDVNSGTTLALNLVGQPGSDTYPLGKPLPIKAGATAEATLELFDNDELVTSVTGQELNFDLRLVEPGEHIIKVVATAGDQIVMDSFTVTGRLTVDVLKPTSRVVTATAGDRVEIAATAYVEADLSIRIGNEILNTTTATNISETFTLPDGGVTTYTITATYRGKTTSSTVTYITGEPEVAAVPTGTRPGATRTANGGLILHLRAPQKNDVFVVGNFNDWSPTAASRMKKSPNDTSFWLQIDPDDLPDNDFIYQYAIDDQGRFADPYSTLVLDPNDDPFIEEAVFAGIPDYPTQNTEGIVSWLRLDAPDYQWKTTDFERPDPTKMVVYELLVRDFLEDHSYKSLTDTLDYLDRLGINTIELMPVSEFEGNISWGYNPSFHMALDKYYGAPEDLKAFVDAAHARGIAVVLDAVYNHAFGESPLIRMWPGAQSFEPGADNPYANVTARHPFNVGYDLNHESALTKEYVKTTVEYWLEEFRVDGFRFDLTKGFTQNFTGNDVEEWGKYDASRIAILKDYADKVWSVNNDAYMIMEHLSEAREENELAQYGNGMYFWSGFQPHDAYLEAARGNISGGQSNFRSVLANNKGFDQRSLIAYMESHDEERMVYKNLEEGLENGSYDIKDLPTALDRVELSSTFFYTLPGAKMLWQFGELGYDYPINYCTDGRIDNQCRTGPKPIVWEYRDQPDRQAVYETISDLLYLRNNFEYFHGTFDALDLVSDVKYAHLNSTDGQAAIIGNFNVIARTSTSVFPSAGTWYDYFSGESIEVTNPGMPVVLQPGEYRLYLSNQEVRGGGRLSTSVNDRAVAQLEFQVSPNPTRGQLHATFKLERSSQVEVSLMDIMGRTVRQLYRGQLTAGNQRIDAEVSDLASGSYFLRITDGSTSAVRQVIIQ